MKDTHEIKAGNYYLFESLSCANASYFDSDEEIKIFNSLMDKYLSQYLEIHRTFIDKTGYQILVRVRQDRTIKKNYVRRCRLKNTEVKIEFLNKPWKIISEMMRLFKSLYVRAINRIRGREGVLVKHNYKKYYFENKAEYEEYVSRMEKGEGIRSQGNGVYEEVMVSGRGFDLKSFRAREWSERFVFKGFQGLVGLKILKRTFLHHNPGLVQNFVF